MVIFVAPGPGQLGDATHHPEQEAAPTVGTAIAEQRMVAAVVHQGETAGQEEHLQGDHGQEQPRGSMQQFQA